MILSRLRRTWTIAACLGAILAGQATAQGMDATYDFHLKDADLGMATKVLSDKTGAQFLIEQSSEPYGKVTMELVGKTAEDAIQYMCLAAGAWAERDESGVYIIRKGKKPESKSGLKVAALPRKTIKVKLLHGDAQTIYNQLVYGSGFKVPDDGQRMIDKSLNSLSRSNDMILINSGVGGPVYLPTNAPVPESGANVMLPGEESNQVGFGGRTGAGQVPGVPGTTTTGTTGTSQGVDLKSGEGFVPEGIDKITYDPNDNSLIVQGDDDAIAKLQRLVSMFDVVPKQVEVKIEFVTTSQSVSKALGFDWLYQRGPIFAGNTPGSFARTGDPIFLNYSSGNVVTRMRTLLLEGNGKAVQSPVVRTLNNQTATVSSVIETNVFYPISTNGPGGIVTTWGSRPMGAATSLTVRPRINEDGTITMFLFPQVSDFGEVRRGPDGTEIPDRLSQMINVVARVKSGETMALAGLTRKQTNTSTSRFPILSDLPIVGQFFKGSNTNRSDSELIIFVTPTVIEDEATGLSSP